MIGDTFRSFKARLWASFRHRKDIDALLSQIPEPQTSLRDRTHWLFDLIDWIRREGVLKHNLDFTTGAPQAARVRYLLQILDRNPEWKKKTARTLRSLIQDSQGIDLFIEVGLSNQDHFLSELSNRLNDKWLPQVPRDHELSYIFGQNFHTADDYQWIRLLDDPTFGRLVDLFHFAVDESEGNWNSLKADAEQALLLLCVQVQGLGISSELRKRISQSHFERSPFYQLPPLAEEFITEPDPKNKAKHCEALQIKIHECKLALNEVHAYLEMHGVSLQVVYKIERLENLLHRISDLLVLLTSNPVDANRLSSFIESLISENLNKRSLSAFFNQMFSLLSRKIVERNGETGEHYITRTPAEYLTLIKSSIGGGILTSFTAIFKFLLHHLPIENFFAGVLASVNYSLSFLAIHFSHFTLGTKQPSSTAPALAARMHAVDDPSAMDSLTDEIINTFRSQFAAILGNVIGVVPMTAIVCWIFHVNFGIPFLSPEESSALLKSFSLFGLTPFYAVFTGILLWLSSLFSGWVENWFTFHQISMALAANRRLIFVIGAKRAETFSLFLRRNVLGIASSISLGFLLGLSPTILHFFGINLEVRHVTLSSGALTTALFSQPLTIFKTGVFWSAVAGIISMAILNVGIAFSLALMLAIKARHVQAPKRIQIYKEVLKKLYKKPKLLFWPS